MKNSFKNQFKVGSFLILMSFIFQPYLQAVSVGSINVMDAESAGEQAEVSRFMAEVQTIKANENGEKKTDEGIYVEDGIIQSGGCGDINIGNIKTEIGASVPSSNIVIINGPVIQKNNCQ